MYAQKSGLKKRLNKCRVLNQFIMFEADPDEVDTGRFDKIFTYNKLGDIAISVSEEKLKPSVNDESNNLAKRKTAASEV